MIIDEKQIAWQNIFTSNQKGKILTGRAIAVETEKIRVVENDRKIEKKIDSIIVNFKNIKILIPAEEIRDGKVDKKVLRSMIGSEIKFIIYKIDKLTNKAVASRKKAMEHIRRNQLKRYEVGDKIFARILSVYPNYIDIECLGADIRLNVEDLEYGFVSNLCTLYQVGDKIKVIITEINSEKNLLKVSHKKTKEDPYKLVRVNYVVGGEYLGIITGYSDNGVFVKLEQGIDTMATLPPWMEMPPAPGDTVVVRIKIMHPEKRKIYSSLLKVVRRENIE